MTAAGRAPYNLFMDLPMLARSLKAPEPPDELLLVG